MSVGGANGFKMSAVERDCRCVIFVYLSSHWCLII